MIIYIYICVCVGLRVLTIYIIIVFSTLLYVIKLKKLYRNADLLKVINGQKSGTI